MSVTHVGYEVEKGPKDKVPEPSAQNPSSKFKVVPGQAMVTVGTNAVAVDWRSPIFRRASNLIIGADGRVQRRTILLEEPPEDAPDFDPVASMPTNLSPETLRALADLEDERQNGGISEAEYHRRRRELLGGVSAPKE